MPNTQTACTIEQAAAALDVQGCNKINFHFRKHYVTASCKRNGYSAGARGATLKEAIENLQQHMLTQETYWGRQAA